MNRLVITASFGIFLVAFTLIGAMAGRRMQNTTEDYLVASRSVNPWLTALSAVSTNNSGYMFIGLIGYAWRAGLEAIWITFGWVLGDLLTWFWVHRRVRAQSEEVGAASVPALLARDAQGKQSRPIAIVAGILTFFFLGGYAAAQLKAGATTLHTLFHWPLWLGSVIGITVVAIYCLSGGIRASIWTDAAQSVVMIGAMTLLVAVSVSQVGGPTELLGRLEAIDPKLVSVVPKGLVFGLGLYVLGFVFGGAATIGQPHILIRFMAIDATESIRKARIIYFVWFIFFSIEALLVGLYARVLLPNLAKGLAKAAAVQASESALPTLSVKLLPPVLIGVMLAGLFSATMSTADSQILSCSAAVTQDVFPRWRSSYRASKVATLSVAGLALAIALWASSGVFSMVLIAWSALGAALGPVLLVRLAKKPLPSWLGLSMMALGLGTVIAWGASPWADSVFKVLPGMLTPLVLYAAAYFAMLRKGEMQNAAS